VLIQSVYFVPYLVIFPFTSPGGFGGLEGPAARYTSRTWTAFNSGFDSDSLTTKPLDVASTTKWVSGTMIMRVVASGALRLNDYCHTFFPWWTRDSSDPRSRVQLKHLLSFTSGYYQLTYGASVPCFRNASMDYLACVRELYETVELRWEPGTVWDYSSLHLKIAGGMAVAASGRSIRELLEETLAELGMTNSYYDMGQNPELAGSLWTTGA